MASKKREITDAITELFKTIDGTGTNQSNLFGNVLNKLVFYDEVKDYPTVSVSAGPETREYLPGGFQWGFIEINIKIYIKQEDPLVELDKIVEDIEALLEATQNLILADDSTVCTDIRIISINDARGILAPREIGEMTIQVQYQAT